MKNKLKKSKIIVPALALITATTVASVTGTVAWFTANRAVSVTASDFVAAKLESNIKVTCTGSIGTAATTDNQGITTTNTNNVANLLTHGSYDAQTITSTSAGSLYVAKVNDDGSTIDQFINLGTEANNKSTTATSSTENWLARSSDTQKIWYGVSWTMKFELEDETANDADYLFFDVAGSKFDSNESNSTAGGFRIAFMTDKTFLVVGGDATKTHVGTKTTITSGTPSYESFEDDNYVAITDTTGKANDATGTDSLKDAKFNLGTIGTVTDDSDNSLTLTCVAWYEGSDDNVKNSNSTGEINMSSISASLNFYTRSYRK